MLAMPENQVSWGRGWSDMQSCWYSSSALVLVGLSCCHGYSIWGLIDEVFTKDIFIGGYHRVGSNPTSHFIMFTGG